MKTKTTKTARKPAQITHMKAKGKAKKGFSIASSFASFTSLTAAFTGKKSAGGIRGAAIKILATLLALAIAIAILPAFVSAADAPILRAVPDITVQKNSQSPAAAIDLSAYANDARDPKEALAYEITGQSNTRLVDCSLQGRSLLICSAPGQDSTGSSEVTVRATNSFGLSDTDTFSINVTEQAAALQGPLTLGTYTISLWQAGTASVPAKVVNTTNSQQCYTLSPVLGNNERRHIELSAGEGDFCLFAGQEMDISLTITALATALPGIYQAEIRLISGNLSVSKFISVKVTGGGSIANMSEAIGIERTSAYYVCNEPFTQQIRLRLTSNSAGRKDISLGAEHAQLLPTFDFPHTTLQPGSAAEIEMKINLNETTRTGDYRVALTATVRNAPAAGAMETSIVQSEIVFGIVDCENTPFGLLVTPEKVSLRRGEAGNFTIRLASNIDEGQNIILSAEAGIPLEVAGASVFLPARGNREVSLRAFARSDENFGVHNISVYAWNQKAEHKKIVQAEIMPEHLVALSVQNNDFDAMISSASSQQALEVTVKNSGAYTEDIALYADSPHRAIQVKLSEPSLRLGAGESRKVLVFINPGIEAPLGNHAAPLVARFGGQQTRLELRFKVVKAAAGNFGSLEITSYPKEIDLNADKEKVLTFVLTNTGSGPLQGVKLSISGLGGAAFFPSQDIGNIAPGKSVTVTGRIYGTPDAGTGTYFAKLEATAANGAKATKDITLRATSAPQGAGAAAGRPDAGNAIAGLFVLAGNAGAAILIFLAGIILAMALLGSGKTRESAAGGN